jgi:hypothetical protein
MPSYGLLTNPSNEILAEINKIYQLGFDFVEIAIEGPEGNPKLIDKNKSEITKLIQKFNQKPIGHTAYWIDLCSDYEYVRHAWILESMREIKAASILSMFMPISMGCFTEIKHVLVCLFYFERECVFGPEKIRLCYSFSKYIGWKKAYGSEITHL